MGAVVVLLDLVHVHCFGNPFHLINLTAVIQQCRRIRYGPGVAFKIDCVDFVEAK
jgi:hypothetical protein